MKAAAEFYIMYSSIRFYDQNDLHAPSTTVQYSQLALLFKGGQNELTLNSTESLNTTVLK